LYSDEKLSHEMSTKSVDPASARPAGLYQMARVIGAGDERAAASERTNATVGREESRRRRCVGRLQPTRPRGKLAKRALHVEIRLTAQRSGCDN